MSPRNRGPARKVEELRGTRLARNHKGIDERKECPLETPKDALFGPGWIDRISLRAEKIQRVECAYCRRIARQNTASKDYKTETNTMNPITTGIRLYPPTTTVETSRPTQPRLLPRGSLNFSPQVLPPSLWRVRCQWRTGVSTRRSESRPTNVPLG